MESRQIAWFAPESSVRILDADGYMKKWKEGADNATGRFDNVDWCRGLILPGLSDYADCRCRPMPSAGLRSVEAPGQ